MPESEVTRILQAVESGSPKAAEELLPLVYEELRRLAASRLARESPGQTLQPTALVHEAYLRLVGGESGQAWECRGHFFAAAAEAMPRILVEAARKRRSLKRGGNFDRLEIDPERLAAPNAESDDELVALDEGLAKLAARDPLKAELVKFRYFAGLTIAEAAAALRISTATADRYWAYARAWLRREIARDSSR
jgi:RNA polymerase sigma factor (TIGR02999 family)